MAEGLYIPPAIERDERLSLGARYLFGVLDSYTSRAVLTVFPSQATVARRMGLRERQVRNLLGQLVDAGHVEVRHRVMNGRSNVYRLHYGSSGDFSFDQSEQARPGGWPGRQSVAEPHRQNFAGDTGNKLPDKSAKEGEDKTPLAPLGQSAGKSGPSGGSGETGDQDAKKDRERRTGMKGEGKRTRAERSEVELVRGLVGGALRCGCCGAAATHADCVPGAVVPWRRSDMRGVQRVWAWAHARCLAAHPEWVPATPVAEIAPPAEVAAPYLREAQSQEEAELLADRWIEFGRAPGAMLEQLAERGREVQAAQLRSSWPEPGSVAYVEWRKKVMVAAAFAGCI